MTSTPLLETADAPLPLIGREHELIALHTWWVHAVDGVGPALAVLTGESGVGKSRVAQDFLTRVRHDGATVLLGVATDHRFLPFEPWIGALRELLSDSSDGREAIVGERIAELAAVPWLRDLVPEPVTPILGVPDESAVQELIVDLLRRAAARTPVLVAIEDVQWCDRGSVELLVRVLGAAIPGLAVVCIERRPSTFRGPWHENDLRLEPRVELALARLDRVTCRALLDVALGRTTPPMLADAVYDASGGNAFVSLSLAAIAARSADPGGALLAVLPREAGELWAARFSAMSDAAAPALALAAVAGMTFEPDVIGQALGDSVRVDAALAQAVTAGLVEPAGPGELRFVHALLREHLYLGLTATRRQRLHRLLARTLTIRLGVQPSSRSAEVAHHWRESGRSGAFETIVHLTRAARWALAQGASDTAADLAVEALTVADDLARCVGQPGRRTLAAHQVELGDVLLRLGHREGVRLMAEATDVLQPSADIDSLARAADALLRASDPLGLAEEGVALAEQIVDRLDDVDPRLHSRILARWSRALEGQAAQAALQSALSAKALRLARAAGDAETLAIALLCHCVDRPWTDDRLTQIRELVELGRAHQNLEYQLLGLHYLYTLLADGGDLAEARAVLEEVLALGERIPPGHLGALKNADLAREAALLAAFRRSVDAQLSGRFDEQQQVITELAGYLTHADLDHERVTTVLIAQQGMLAFDRGDLEALADLSVAFAEEHPDTWQGAICAGFVLACLGRTGEAERFYRPFVADGLTGISDDQTTAFMLILLAHTAAMLGDSTGAALLERRLAPYAGRNSCYVGGSVGPTDLARARCLAVLGDLHGALALADAAVQQCAQWELPTFLARAHLARGQFHAAAGARESAVRDARVAADLAEALGMPVVARDARRIVESQ